MASTSDTNEWTPQNTMRRVQSISMFSTESPRRVAGWDMGGAGRGGGKTKYGKPVFFNHDSF